MHTDDHWVEKLDHALVIGGSMAGMLAARVLADHFERVTIVERDHLTEEGPVPRKGVPQARHVHALLKRGRITLERLFPGIGEELVAAGAPTLDMAKDIAWLNPAGWGVRFSSDLGFVTFSRDLLDWHVRRRLAADNDGVRFLKGYDVTGLIPNAVGTGVAGVRVRLRNRTYGSGEEVLHANLVVDATGRASRAPEWLEVLGYPRPEETTINAHLGDASRVYRRPPGFRADWKMAFVQAAPPDVTRGALLLPIEGDRWILTLAGRDRDYPPTDEAAFMEFARSLRSSIINDAIEGAEPLSPIHGFRQTANRRRHYEKLSRQPHNFLVTGDAACAFNPVYAQGVTTAALGAEVLDECLRKQRRRGGDLTGLARGYQKRLAKVNKAPWMLATGEDFRVHGVEGGKPNAVNRWMHRYMDRVLELSTQDARVRLTLLEVFNLVKPPTAILGPATAAKVLRRTIVRRFGAAVPPVGGSELPEAV